MNKISRFVIWICSKFTREEIEEIISGLSDVLANRNPDVKPKDDFKEKHPNYRNFFVDPNPPLPEPAKKTPVSGWKDRLKKFELENGRPLKPVTPRDPKNIIPNDSICYNCGAPADYLYYNDGKKRSQIRCKICGSFSPIHPRHRLKAKYFCPYCQRPLYLWKSRKDVSVYKCDNDNCPTYVSNKSKLNFGERILRTIRSSQFKLRYQYREYHFTQEQLSHSAPSRECGSSLTNIHNSLNTLALILSFHISFAISARKTAYILRQIFSIKMSYQTVLNYSQQAAYYCHRFNLKYKGAVDNIQPGDETYIKIKGKNAYTFFFISPKSRKITSYHIDHSRTTLPATIAMNEAIRTAKPDQTITLITDGNPSYPAGIHFLNQSVKEPISHKKVIGLQNLDTESETYRPFKELIERLMRTYKFHTRAANGFNIKNGAVALTTLFVTYYNFLRPHFALNYSVPIPIKSILNIFTLQGRWAKLLEMALAL